MKNGGWQRWNDETKSLRKMMYALFLEYCHHSEYTDQEWYLEMPVPWYFSSLKVGPIEIFTVQESFRSENRNLAIIVSMTLAYVNIKAPDKFASRDLSSSFQFERHTFDAFLQALTWGSSLESCWHVLIPPLFKTFSSIACYIFSLHFIRHGLLVWLHISWLQNKQFHH